MTKRAIAFIAAATAAMVALIVFGLPMIRGFSTANTSFKDCPQCPEMVAIPAGEFIMGSPASELFRGLEQQHRVMMRSPFALGKYEITFAQWESCLADGGCDGPGVDDHGWGKGNRPVIDVTWDEARSYAAWLSKKTGKHYRLPSEAEWEYAARAGTATPFSFGATATADQANYDGSTGYGDGPAGLNRQQTLAVGSFPPNAFGLHDMHGNVREWVEDCWHDGYGEEGPANGAPYVGADCGEHVIRGGSWEDEPGDVRAAARAGRTRDEQSWAGGFRVARSNE